MKKKILSLLFVVAITIGVSAMSAFAWDTIITVTDEYGVESQILDDMGEYTLLKYNTNGMDLRNTELIGTYYGSPISRINANAFSDCHHLETMIIPSTYTTIDDGAFSGCDGVTFTFQYTASDLQKASAEYENMLADCARIMVLETLSEEANLTANVDSERYKDGYAIYSDTFNPTNYNGNAWNKYRWNVNSKSAGATLPDADANIKLGLHYYVAEGEEAKTVPTPDNTSLSLIGEYAGTNYVKYTE